MYNAKRGQKLFQKAKSGDNDANRSLIEEDKRLLFDYVMRMTGVVDLSYNTVDEVFMSMAENNSQTFDSLEEFRRCLYTTARKFTADRWNADTSVLSNTALTEPTQELNIHPKKAELYKQVDASVSRLAGSMREAILLKLRCGFDDVDGADIMGIGREQFESSFLQGMQRVDADFPSTGSNPEKIVAELPLHPFPDRDDGVTMDLGQVMAGIKQKPAGLRSPFRYAVLLILMFLIAAWFFYPEFYKTLGVLDLLKSITGK